MSKCLAVFRSKTELFIFIDALKSRGVRVTTAPVPKEARIGCGLSAAFEERFLSISKAFIREKSLSSFYAIYRVTKNGQRTSTSQIYP
ncbi:MAG: DUF3343 domain-containing protein [Clostridia bacterium]|nr:DUF3343 domain-containing protein [Clostridia bacterium]